MFPPKREPFIPTIYARYKACLGVQLVVDKVWKYVLGDSDQLTVQFRKPDDTVALEKVYTASDVDPDDKIVNVELDAEDTNLPDGIYYLCAFVGSFVVINARPIAIRKVVSL